MDYNWSERTTNLVSWRGEKFYTVTSLPLYIHRRQQILTTIQKEIDNNLENTSFPVRILDFGCGDGYYSSLLKKQYNHAVDIIAYDTDPSMLDMTRRRSADEKTPVTVIDSLEELNKQPKFDIILCIAVLAHVTGHNKVASLIDSFSSLLNLNGHLVVFEQTGTVPRKGSFWIKRTQAGYNKLFFKKFSHEEYKFISYPTFARLDKKLRWLNHLPALPFSKTPQPRQRTLYLSCATLLFPITLFFDRFCKPKEGNSLWVLVSQGNKNKGHT